MDVQKLIIDNGSLNSRLKNSSSQMKLLQEKVEQIKSSRRYGNNFYSDLVDNLNQLFECPLSMAELTSPTILPSGITVQEDYCNELMKRGSKDPYNKTLYVRQKIVNRFVLNVKEVLSESQMKITAEQAKFKDQQNLLSVEIQTDFIVRSKDDIAKIDLLKKKQNRRFREKLSTVTKNYDKLKLFSHNQENVLKLYEHHLKKKSDSKNLNHQVNF